MLPLEKIAQFNPSRVFARTKQTRYGNRTAGIRPGCCSLPAFTTEPSTKEAGHECISSSDAIQYRHFQSIASNRLAQHALVTSRKNLAAFVAPPTNDGRTT